MSPVRLALRIASLVLAGVLLFLAGWRFAMVRAHQQTGSPVAAAPQDYGKVAPFQFVNQSDQPVSLDTLKGQVWVASFIFTRCAGPCPVITQQMGALARQFKDKRDLRFVTFTVDPDYDRPAVLAGYARRVGADTTRWQFVTGPREDVYKLIRQSFHLAAEPQEPTATGEIDIMHSLYFVLVDGEGRIAGVYDSTDAAAMERLQAELGRLP